MPKRGCTCLLLLLRQEWKSIKPGYNIQLVCLLNCVFNHIFLLHLWIENIGHAFAGDVFDFGQCLSYRNWRVQKHIRLSRSKRALTVSFARLLLFNWLGSISRTVPITYSASGKGACEQIRYDTLPVEL